MTTINYGRGASYMTVAKTILDQLGGNKFIAMTGSKNFIGGDDFLSMRLARNKSGANYLRITLSSMDDYTVEFFKMTKFDLISVYSSGGVYCDQLQNLFTSVTGLDTRLCER